MVPENGAFGVTPRRYHKDLKELIREGKDSHSLVYGQDASFRRWLRVLKNHLGNMKRFKRYNKKPVD